MSRILCLAFILSCSVLVSADRPSTIIINHHARFQFYSDEMVRLEWSPLSDYDNGFDDLTTAAVPCRICVQTQPIVTTQTSNNSTVLRTSALQLTYSYEPESLSPFTKENLQIEILANGKVWHFGDIDTFNLNGTYTSLDCCELLLRLFLKSLCLRSCH